MSMIASVLSLDRSAMKALRITDTYSLHRVVYGLFSDERDDQAKTDSKPSGILWADQGGDFHERQILLLSNREPAQCADGGYGRVQSRPIPEGFLDHTHYRFKVVVNPTRRNSASKQLMPVKGHAEVMAWFQSRCLSSWGFEASGEHLQIDRTEVQQFKDKAQRPVTLSQAHVQGRLIVRNRDQFRQSFEQGIGRGRSFGCGLLQIVPIVSQTEIQGGLS